jgi:hypothetical protein
MDDPWMNFPLPLVITAFVGDTVITSNNYQRGQTYTLKVQDLLAIQLSNITNCMAN